MWAWGDNLYRQLGDGTTTDRTTPVQVSGLSSVKNVSSGAYHSLALKEDGTVWAWGSNGAGTLGDGTNIHRATPVKVSGLSGVKDVAGGWRHSLAVKEDGTAWAWGYNYSGELGDGTTTDRTTPVRVSDLSGVKDVAGGFQHSLALKEDGTVWAWEVTATDSWAAGAIVNTSARPLERSAASTTSWVCRAELSTTWSSRTTGRYGPGGDLIAAPRSHDPDAGRRPKRHHVRSGQQLRRLL